MTTTEHSLADALTYQQVEALAAKHLFDMSTFDYTDSNSLVDLVNDAIRAASRASQPAAAPIDPRANRGRSVGDWLWCELMDYCKERGMPPASNGRLFNLVDCARAAWDGAQSATSAPPAPADARVGLTDEHRTLIERAEERLRGRGPEDAAAANGLLEVLTAHPGQPEPRAEVTHGDTTMDECMASLLDRMEAAELDADRYRYLRERPLDTVSAGGVFAGKTPDNVVLNGADLDAAVDAARTGASS